VLSLRYRLELAIRRFLSAPSRWLDNFARWKLGPPVDVRRVECSKCFRYVPAWRSYADGKKECIYCAHGLPYGVAS
jgi:hypothetical protein